MYQDLKGKVALITGSGKKTGIGYAIAERLASMGMHIIMADLGSLLPDGRQWEEMLGLSRELSRRFNVKVLPVSVDITNTSSVKEMSETINKEFENLDVLCNNAGASFGVPSSVADYDEDAWMKTIDTNLHGTFRVSRAVLPMMLKTGGSIINTASRAGKVPPLFNGAYAVAKAGVIMLTKVMARELAPSGIRVNAICPGQIMTDLEKWRFSIEAEFFGTTIEEREKEMCKTIPLGRIGKPSEVAALVAFLASSESSYLTGQAINITGGQLMEL